MDVKASREINLLARIEPIIAIMIVVASTAIIAAVVTSPHDDHYYVALTAYATAYLVLATVYMMSNQSEKNERVAKLQMLLQLMTTHQSAPIRVARRRLSMFLPFQSGGTAALNTPDADTVLDFFETIAYLTRKKYLDYEMISNDFSINIRCYWIALRQYILMKRTTYNDTNFYEHMEWLNNQFMKEYAAQIEESASTAEPTETQLRDFFQSEGGQ